MIVIVQKEHRYREQFYRAGDRYDALDKDMALLEGTGLATRDMKPEAAEAVRSNEAKGRYRRRDMRPAK